MLAAFAAAIWRALAARRMAFRLLAAGLAFLPAMLFGVAAVNKYYDYYQTWGAAFGDLTNQGAPLQVAVAPGGSRISLARLLGSHVDTALAEQDGFTFRLTVPGPVSHISRAVWVYLPPQYFQSGYARYHFPVMELIHGFPGVPQDWISIVGITAALREEIALGQAKPVVVVMPDANGARGVSLQCLNQLHGPQDATYLARDLPRAITKALRVQPPGRAWGIAGYSEGGFCAADLGLRYWHSYGFAAVLSGYFVPFDNQLGNPPRLVSPYGNHPRLRREDTPEDLVTSLPARDRLPLFWLGAGAGSRLDSTNARVFGQLLQVRQGTVPVRLVKGGQHTMFNWRALVPPMLAWMTPQLAHNAAQASARVIARRAEHGLSRLRTARTRVARLGDHVSSGHQSSGHRKAPHHPRHPKKNHHHPRHLA
ncbi:MAG: alpha/beta hydrolase-fold protein [Actinomycetota bacterium]